MGCIQTTTERQRYSYHRTRHGTTSRNISALYVIVVQRWNCDTFLLLVENEYYQIYGEYGPVSYYKNMIETKSRIHSI